MTMQKLPSFFQTVCLLFSAAAVVLLVAVFGGLVIFPSPEALVAAVTSGEILFAVRLSVVTAIVSTAACMVAAIPIAYAMTRVSFAGKR